MANLNEKSKNIVYDEQGNPVPSETAVNEEESLAKEDNNNQNDMKDENGLQEQFEENLEEESDEENDD